MSGLKRIIIGISGASGASYGVRLLELLRPLADVETHLVISEAAEITLKHEMDKEADDIAPLADKTYGIDDIGAAIASGSFPVHGMIVAPCSIRTLSAIAYGNASNLLVRAADVSLKERRPLVLLVRETPLHAGHLKAMLAVTEMGATVAPPVPAFYAKPETIDDMVTQTAARTAGLLGIETGKQTEWQGTA